MSTDRTQTVHATLHELPVDGDGPSRLVLRIFDGSAVRTVALGAGGVLEIGRSSRADITIDAPSVSRSHARLHVGRTLQLEDLGSVNGTQVRGAPVEKGRRVDLVPGDEVLIGKVLCVVHGAGRFSPPAHLRTLRTHEYFEARLDDECAMATASGQGFSLVRLRVDGAAGAGFEGSLMAAALPSEVVAWYGPGDYEVLLPGVGDATARVEALVAELSRAGWRVSTGVASHPRHGRSPDTLIEHAGDALRDAAQEPVVHAPDDIVVDDPVMRNLHKLVARFAASDISLLLLGETGTGKEVFASQIHKLSPRARGPFCKLNCAAFTETLIESELFGHEKGAFTGADRAQPGLLESAQGGTVFLDEVGELSQSLQAKLLRVLEDRKVRRIGGREERALDVRFIAATNRDLEREIEADRFRGDLFFRLNGFPFEIPPLRARTSEIAPLARRFLAMGASRARAARAPTLSAGALALLEGYAWPGNIRELRNVMDRALVIADGDVISPEHLRMASSKLRPAAPAAASARPAASVNPPAGEAPTGGRAELTLETARPLSDVLDEAEKDYVRRVLELCLNNQTRAADVLGVSRGKIVNLIEKHKLPRPRGG